MAVAEPVVDTRVDLVAAAATVGPSPLERLALVADLVHRRRVAVRRDDPRRPPRAGRQPARPADPRRDPARGRPARTASCSASDSIGRDILSRMLYGMRASWFAALRGGLRRPRSSAASSAWSPAPSGGWVDNVLMRITDGFLALPAPVLAIAVVAVARPQLRAHPDRGVDRVVAVLRTDHARRDRQVRLAAARRGRAAGRRRADADRLPAPAARRGARRPPSPPASTSGTWS